MTGGVRVVQPDELPGERTPEIDTVTVEVEGGLRERQRIVVADSDPRIVWDEAVSVTPGETATVTSLVGEERLRLIGFSATGTGDAVFRLMVDGRVVQSGQINVTNPVLVMHLPVGYPLGRGVVATVQVAARGDGLSHYEATIYGEVTSG